jgi:N-hydroxyarylamine O-acetyltransferase
MDLPAYAARIGYTGTFAPNSETLHELHLAHATHIPFENLDILLGRPIRLDLDSLWRKLVEDNRGGYCFEQNALFAAVLEASGFQVTRLAARVRMGANGIRPRSHMLLMVDLNGERLIADVGFGGEGLLYPIPFILNQVVSHFTWKYRIVAEGSAFVLQSQRPEGWLDLYSFTLEEQHAVDYEVSNYFTSTNPSSIFVRMLLAQKPGADRRLALLNRKFVDRTPESTSEIVLPDDDALLAVLAEHFSLRFPAGTRFRYEDDAATQRFEASSNA